MRNILFLFCLVFFVACQNETQHTTEDVQEKEISDTDNTPIAVPQPIKVNTKKDTTEVTEEKTEDPVVQKVEKPAPKVEKKQEVRKKRSRITFEETNWSFGEIKAGDIVNHNFKFKNTGEAPLTIKNVTATCGCTQPSFPFLPINPGEEGVIGVTFNSTGKINTQRPTVTVFTNSRPSTYKLYLEGTVLQK